ncbi:hypothetical protein GO730_27360 [Spirosoma sp. HMF3257]|uniref:hypothetical protein n=1 Tax=Spirosoma telluris TaxID=2183553 RepID=UPI0012FCB253|nr:hypothetical protein [Spirosoma telluris]
MKKQFIIKSAQAIKNVIIPATKLESANILKLAADDKVCCGGFDVGFTGLANSKPVFSL